jgi:hypothetical protein
MPIGRWQILSALKTKREYGVASVTARRCLAYAKDSTDVQREIKLFSVISSDTPSLQVGKLNAAERTQLIKRNDATIESLAILNALF